MWRHESREPRDSEPGCSGLGAEAAPAPSGRSLSAQGRAGQDGFKEMFLLQDCPLWKIG